MHLEHALAQSHTNVAAAGNMAGKWKNELGSTAEFHVAADGVITGTYHSAVGLNGHPEDALAVAGYIAGDLFSLTAKFSGGICAWVGHLDRDVLKTLWQLTVSTPDGSGGFWHSVYAGADEFTR